MNRPVSGSDFGYQIPLSDGLHTIVDGLEYDETAATVADQQQHQQQSVVNGDSLPPTYECAMLSASSNGNGNGNGCDNLTPLGLAERSSLRLQHQISSGVGTQQNDSRDEATYTESIELRLLGQYNSTDTDPYAFAPDQRSGSFDTDEAYLKYQKSLLTRSPSYRKSLDRLSQSSGQSQRSLLPSRLSLKSDESAMRRHSSGHSLNSISLEQDELLSQQANLREELLNCDQKELFQFLQEDEELLQGKATREREKKQTTNSIKSNLSYISNTIMQTLDSRHSSNGNGSVHGQHESEPLMEHSEFDNIIQSFEKELEEIKRSTSSLERKISTLSEPSPAADEATKAIMDHIAIITGASDRTAADEVVHPLNPYDSYDLSSVPRRSQSVSAAAQRQSVKLKRRSLEKQRKIDEDFSISNEIRKICDQIHAPFAAMEALAVAATSASGSGSGAGASGISGGQSPFMRRKNDPFSVQFDRFKRLSLIERVEELPEEDKPISTLRIESEKMPRKFLNSDKLRMDSMSLKSTNSYENLLIQKQLCRDGGHQLPATPPTSLKSSIEPPTLAQISSLKATPPLAALTEHQQHYHATSIQTTDTAAAATAIATATRQQQAITTNKGQQHPSAVGVAAGRRRAEHPQSTLDKAASFQSARTESHSSGAADSSSALGLASLGQHVAGKRSISNGQGHDHGGASEKTELTQQASSSKPASAFSRLTEKPWHCLVSYVDDLTVGGRRNSQGAYNDPMTFPSFGQAKPPKVPDDCFPQKCYEQ